jgi:broad specificity phosphatase PhoE
MSIYIRHSKEKDNRKYDSSLSSEGIEQVKKTTKKLIDLYGKPKYIYCSPFERARQTTEEMAKITGAEMIIESDLSKFVKSKDRDHSRSKTRKEVEDWGETEDEYKSRVLSYVKFSTKRSNPSIIKWYVSHAHALKLIGSEFKIALPDYLSPCFWLNLDTKETKEIYKPKLKEVTVSSFSAPIINVSMMATKVPDKNKGLMF